MGRQAHGAGHHISISSSSSHILRIFFAFGSVHWERSISQSLVVKPCDELGFHSPLWHFITSSTATRTGDASELDCGMLDVSARDHGKHGVMRVES